MADGSFEHTNKGYKADIQQSEVTITSSIQKLGTTPATVPLTVKHIPGVPNPADYMSRHPTDVQLQSHEEINAEYVNFLAYESIPKSVTLHHIVAASFTETALQLAIAAVHTGRRHDAKANTNSSQL